MFKRLYLLWGCTLRFVSPSLLELNLPIMVQYLKQEDSRIQDGLVIFILSISCYFFFLFILQCRSCQPVKVEFIHCSGMKNLIAFQTFTFGQILDTTYWQQVSNLDTGYDSSSYLNNIFNWRQMTQLRHLGTSPVLWWVCVAQY